MVTPVVLAVGDHWLISDPVVHWEPQFADTNPPSVVLTASIQAGPNPPLFPTKGRTATSLAVQMDARVAIALYERLGALIRTMGWRPREEDDNQD